MSISVLQAASRVAARARDAQFTGTAQASVFNLLSRMQTIVNGASEAVIQSTTLSILPQKQVYSISGMLPNALRIVDVRDSVGRSLDGPIPYQSLKWFNSDWWRETGPELRSYCLVGKDLLIVRPGLQVGQTATVYYAAITAPLSVPADVFEIPDEDIETVLDPVEFLLDLKSRDLDNCKAIFERWGKQIQSIRGEVR